MFTKSRSCLTSNDRVNGFILACSTVLLGIAFGCKSLSESSDERPNLGSPTVRDRLDLVTGASEGQRLVTLGGKIEFGTRVHILPLRDPKVSGKGLAVLGVPAGAHLSYFGGRVVSNMQVVQVLWGSGTFEPHVTATTTPSIASFYQQALGGGLTGWLDSEYNTASPTGTRTNQRIGAGSYAGIFTITPASSSTTIDDLTIQTEISNQIAAGRLPAPTRDVAGNNNTYYAVYFPKGKGITLSGSSSCSSGGFCAYHGTVANAAGFGEIEYGVHPDMQAGSGCDVGCGSSSIFGNYTSVASHELIETITDAEVGVATTNGPPLAWYDINNGEIGDICNGQQSTVTGCDGNVYTVQTEFSNAQNKCIAWPAANCSAQDFRIAANPNALALQVGSSGTSSVTTAAIGGSGTVSLTAIGAPSGVTVSFSPSTVIAGAPSTVTLAVATTAATGTSTITINGTEGTQNHSTNLALTVNPPPTPPSDGITNGTFEVGTFSGWGLAGTLSIAATGCHGGNRCAMIGSTNPTGGDSSLSQTFTVPTGKSSLNIFYKLSCPDIVRFDWATVTLLDRTTNNTNTLLAKTCTNSGKWVSLSANVIAGRSYTLMLTSHDDNFKGDATFALFDDITLK